ncbi:recombinase family protein [Streptomyces sp. MI02-7b]|uniref:recombinase family protein n=1 Tax=Streptomyces sp. MI02-7b TaxID=462941 RepID=UPI0039F487FE
MARMMCVMALKSSEDTARRVARMHLATAQDGRIQGRIAYGWIRKGPDKGKTLPAEAAVVTALFNDFLSGESAYSLAKKLNDNKVMPPAAAQWSARFSATRATQAWSPTADATGRRHPRLGRLVPRPARQLGHDHRAQGVEPDPVRTPAPPSAMQSRRRGVQVPRDWPLPALGRPHRRQIRSGPRRPPQQQNPGPRLPVPAHCTRGMPRHLDQCPASDFVAGLVSCGS